VRLTVVTQFAKLSHYPPGPHSRATPAAGWSAARRATFPQRSLNRTFTATSRISNWLAVPIRVSMLCRFAGVPLAGPVTWRMRR